MSEYLLEVKDLKQYFPVSTGWFSSKPLKAVDGVSFNIKPGATLGLVGESGCGKTTVGRTILHLYKPTAGEIIYDGTRITSQNIKDFRQQMQIVFQDPYSSLNPRMTVSDIVGEPLDIHGLYENKQQRAERITELLNLVGLNSDHARRYAHYALMPVPVLKNKASAPGRRYIQALFDGIDDFVLQPAAQQIAFFHKTSHLLSNRFP